MTTLEYPCSSDIGLIGLAVMGQNLALNIVDHKYEVSVFNRTYEKTASFIEGYDGAPGQLHGFKSLNKFVFSLKKPRKIIILVQAGNATDSVIEALTPLLEKNDIIIDGGNAKWEDTIRREAALSQKQILFIGSGVSGGEEGARFGPSLMPGGSLEAWEGIKQIWKAIAAKVDPKTGKPIPGATPGNPTTRGEACTTYIGPNGSGHYVKMVHNGIEYGDMQMICEAYHILRLILELTPHEISNIFSEWNNGPLDSFLIEITANILDKIDPTNNSPLIDSILDTAGQKGTGKWTSVNALDLGVSAPTFSEAVFARYISSQKEERVHASKILPSLNKVPIRDKKEFIKSVHDALYCSKICSYAQGFQLMQKASKLNMWDLDFGKIAKIFRGGCIIRAAFLQKITDAYEKNPSLENLLLDDYFLKAINASQKNWRGVIGAAIASGIPVPTFSSAISYYDSYRTENLPQDLLQAQRDYFGAHTYERKDRPRGKFYHFDWLGKMGNKEIEVN